MHLFLSILMIFAIANVSFAENMDEICFTTIMIIILSIHIFVWMLKVQLLWIPFLRLPCEIYNQPWDKNLERTHRRQIVELVTVSVPKIYVQWCCIGEKGPLLKLSSPRSIAKMSLQIQFHHPWKIGKNILHSDKVTHSSPIHYGRFKKILFVKSMKWAVQESLVYIVNI